MTLAGTRLKVTTPRFATTAAAAADGVARDDGAADEQRAGIGGDEVAGDGDDWGGGGGGGGGAAGEGAVSSRAASPVLHPSQIITELGTIDAVRAALDEHFGISLTETATLDLRSSKVAPPLLHEF